MTIEFPKTMSIAREQRREAVAQQRSVAEASSALRMSRTDQLRIVALAIVGLGAIWFMTRRQRARA